MTLKYFIRAIFSIFLIIAVIIVPFKLYGELNTDKITDELYRRREKYFYGVINLWQIDSFEGGTGSRANFLKEITKKFEKRNNGVFVNIESITAEKAEKLIKSGQKKPDIISYGAGVDIDEKILAELNLIKNPNTVKNIKNKAVPWCMGAYFMIGDSDKTKWGNDGFVKQTKKGNTNVFSVGIPERKGHNASGTVSLEIVSEYGVFTGDSTEVFEAYNYSKKVNRMIGTQRDLYRLQSLEKRDLAREGDVTFLECSDLFQYVSVFICSESKKMTALNSYVNFLLETEQQNKMGDIGMFPVMKEAEPQYSISHMQTAWSYIQNNGIKEILQKEG